MYLANIHFKINGEIKSFHDKDKLKHFMTTKTLLQKTLKGNLYTEEDKPHSGEHKKNAFHKRNKQKYERISHVQLRKPPKIIMYIRTK